MITTFGVTAPTGVRPIAVVAPMCHRPIEVPITTNTNRPCNDHGVDVVVRLPTPETTTTTLKDLTVVCSGGAAFNPVREVPRKNPASTRNRSVPTQRTSPFRNSMPITAIGTPLPGTDTQEASLLGNGAQMTSFPGTSEQETSVLGASSLGASSLGASWLGLPCLEMTPKWNDSDRRATSRECCQIDARTVKDCLDGVAASLRGPTLDTPLKTMLEFSDLIFKETAPSSVLTAPSSQSGYRLSAESPEQRDLSNAVDECNFYYGPMTNSEAKSRLHRCSVGTFLLRDSSDSRFRYSLSVKTTRGTTSIRIVGTSNGHFRLDSDPHQDSRMPAFRWILSLAEHYYLSASQSQGSSTTEKGKRRGHCVLLESSGRYDTPMVLRRPLELSPAPLAHLCRRTINNIVPSAEDRRKLIACQTVEMDALRRRVLQEYMVAYPFRV